MTYQIQNLKVASKIELAEGNRLVRIIAKSGKVNGREMESQGCIIPELRKNTLSVILDNEHGFEFIKNAVQSVQDELIRKLVGQGKMAVFDSQFDLDAILVSMRESVESTRFSKESIGKWFVEHMQPVLVDAIQSKMPGIDGSQLAKLLGNYLESFQILAARQPTMKDSIKAGLVRALELLPEDHDTVCANEIAARLAVVQDAQVTLLAL